MVQHIQDKIAKETNEKEQFINKIREIFAKTPNETERANRLTVFDTLLLLATYADSATLENEFQKSLPPHQSGDTISYMCEQLREINGVCTGSFSDDHELYKNLFSDITFPTTAIKQTLRSQLSKAISTMIFEKTYTNEFINTYK